VLQVIASTSLYVSFNPCIPASSTRTQSNDARFGARAAGGLMCFTADCTVRFFLRLAELKTGQIPLHNLITTFWIRFVSHFSGSFVSTA